MGNSVATRKRSARRVVSMAAVCSAAILVSQSARAADTLWNVQDGNWNVGGNWNTEVLPGAGDAALIAFLGTGNPTTHVNTDVGTVQKLSVSLNNKLSVETGGIVTANGGNNGGLGIRIGDGSIGLADVSGTGQLKTSVADNGGDLHVGIAGGNGTLNLGGNGLVSPRDVKIGDGGGSTGLFTQTGGTTTVGGPGGGWLFVGLGGGTGTYNMSGGTLNTTGTDNRQMRIGGDNGSNGTFTVSGSAVVNMLGELDVGLDGGTGTLNVNGGSISITQVLNVGRSGGAKGTVNHNAGTTAVAWADIGAGGGQLGTFNMSGGNFSTNFEVNVGRDTGGNGVFTMTGGTVTTGTGGANDFDIGRNGATGAFTMSGGTIHAQGSFLIGRGGNGTFVMNGGDILADTSVMLASNDGAAIATASGTQTAGTVHSKNWISIGADRSASYNLSGGSLIADADFNVSDNANTTGTLFLSGTGIAQGGTVYLGKQPGTIAVVNQTGGTMKVGGGGLVIASNATATGTYNLSGGVLDMQGNNITTGPGNGTFNMTGGRLKNANMINFALNQAGGTLAPGASPGRTTITGAYTQQGAATLEIEINGVNVVTDYDQLVVGGQVTIVGDLSVLVGAGFTAPISQQFEILDNQSATDVLGIFTGKPEGSTFTVGSNTFQISYIGGTGNDIVLTAVAVPEPATVGLLGLAAAGALGMRRRRRSTMA